MRNAPNLYPSTASSIRRPLFVALLLASSVWGLVPAAPVRADSPDAAIIAGSEFIAATSALGVAQPGPDAGNVVLPDEEASGLSLTAMLKAGGMIGYVIVLLSLVMVALIADHILTIRRTTLMPPGLAEEVHRAISERRFDDAKKNCDQLPSFLGRLLHSGLSEVGLGYQTIEKAMEDTAVEQSARLFRRIEYLSVIGTLAPMVGLMGTVWGMIQAFLEFEQKANPQVSELAPGIYRALITTLLGLAVAVPSLAAFAIFRNRIDELSAESTLLAEHVFSDYRRSLKIRRKSAQADTV